jgi:DNA-binding SARP family transcriptional activator/predicted ATPase/Tfp pilus assembly protein PilF
MPPLIAKDSKQISLYLFGSPRLEVDGAKAPIRRRKSMGLLAYLAVTGQAHGRSALAALLWPENNRSCALASLRQALSEIKEGAGNALFAVERESVALQPGEPLWLDVAAFRGCLAAAGIREGAGATAALMEAVALYRADFMTDFLLRDAPDFDAWQFAQAEAFRQQVSQALEQLVRLLVEQERLEEAISFACRRAALDPFHEPAHEELLRLYISSGRLATAVRHYDLHSRQMEAELGILPSKSVADLLRETTLPKATNEAPQTARPELTHPRSPCSTLPRSLTPFAGRTDEMKAVIARLGNPACALLNLVGPGGIGKTRLALEVARQIENQFADGVHFVTLVAVDSLEGLITAIGHTLQLSFYGTEDLERQLIQRLEGQNLLLILDNFEQLAHHAGALTRLLTAVPGLKLLVTSRCRLNLQEEWLFLVPGLRYPPAQDDPACASYEAVDFFIQAVRRICPQCVLQAGDLPHIARICQLVDGLPLGIELAAAWVRNLSCREIADVIATQAHVLATTWTNTPPRHASLEAVCAHSWQLLAATEQEIAAQLSLFCGGFDAAAAYAVAGARLPLLTSLVDHSLLRHTLATGQAEARFQMHDVIRRYAGSRLEADAPGFRKACIRFADYYTTFLRDRECLLQNKRQMTAVAEIELELGNIRAAWAWAATYRVAQATDRGTAPLYLFYDATGMFHQGVEDFDLALGHWQSESACSTTPELRWLLARLLVRHGLLLNRLSECGKAEASLHDGMAHLQASAVAAPDRHGQLEKLLPDERQMRYEQAIALTGLAEVCWAQNRRRQATERYNQSLAHFQFLGDKPGVARVFVSLGNLAVERADYENALRLYQESLALNQELGSPVGIAGCLNNFSHIAEIRGDYRQAEKWLQESLATAQQASAWWITAVVFSNLAHIAVLQEQYDQATIYLQKSLALRQQYRLPGLAETQGAMDAIPRR